MPRKHHPRQKRPKRQRRQVWIYPCKNHPATKCRSHFKINYDLELCAKCRKATPDERQTNLFQVGVDLGAPEGDTTIISMRQPDGSVVIVREGEPKVIQPA